MTQRDFVQEQKDILFGALRCSRCNHPLKTAVSKLLGLGPACAQKAGYRSARVSSLARQVTVRLDTQDVVLKREIRGDVEVIITNVPHMWRAHCPSGFEWGYGGSGPSDLALNILLKMRLGRDAAWSLHQQFKEAFLVAAPREGCTIAFSDILCWIKEKKNRGHV